MSFFSPPEIIEIVLAGFASVNRSIIKNLFFFVIFFFFNQMIDSGRPDGQQSQRDMTEGKTCYVAAKQEHDWRPLEEKGNGQYLHSWKMLPQAVTSWYMQKKKRKKTKTNKTHVKAKERWHPHIYTALCRRAHKLTPRGTFTLSAHVFLGKASD